MRSGQALERAAYPCFTHLMDSQDVLATLTLDPPGGPWTVDEFMALPETHTKIELQDGCIVVSPSPTSAHQYCVKRLLGELTLQLDGDHVALSELDTILSATTVRRPDVVVVSRDVLDAGKRYPESADVVLAVEVVSPSSTGTDRLLKPAEYAAAGIPGYWRIELEPTISLEAFALHGGAYTSLCVWHAGETAAIAEPLAAEVAIDALAWAPRDPTSR